MNDLGCSNVKPSSTPQRIVWIDWMKAIGMYFIVLGHVFTWGAEFVYTFNVPLFFFLSGFLCKNYEIKTTIRKVFYNLFVPMILIVITNNIVRILISQDDLNPSVLVRLIEGIRIGEWKTLREMWFVYTLIILKIYYLLFPKKLGLIMGGVSFVLISLLYNKFPAETTYNAFLCIGLAYPFFLFGLFLRKFQKHFNSYDNKIVLLVILFICMYIVHYCGRHNGLVFIFSCNYGNSFILFLIGGIAGIAWTFCLSKLISFRLLSLTKISVGSILILGFHQYFIEFGKMWYQDSYLIDYLLSVIIVILFIPIILLAEKYFPLILGKERMTY